MEAVPVTERSQIAEARRRAEAAATALGFADEPRARVALVATELATNTMRHGGGGEILIGSFEDLLGTGVEILAIDKGPGMANFELCLTDGFSTAGSGGNGLGAIKRLSHAFDVYAPPSRGTVALARLRDRPPRRVTGMAAEAAPLASGLTVPVRGEVACGDAFAIRWLDDGWLVLLADGLGHGPDAARAARAAVQIFESAAETAPADLLVLIHAGIRATRGAAVSVARYDSNRGMLVFAGVGNVSGVVVLDGVPKRMVSHAGTIGLVARRIQPFEQAMPTGSLFVMHSDGIGTSWDLGAYPGLMTANPTLVAAVLYRDHGRGRDDAGVLVARREPLQ